MQPSFGKVPWCVKHLYILISPFVADPDIEGNYSIQRLNGDSWINTGLKICCKCFYRVFDADNS